MIGCNNMLRGDDVAYMTDQLKMLLGTLKELGKTKDLILIPLPVIPKLFMGSEDHFAKLSDFNSFIMRCSEPGIRVLDTTHYFFKQSENRCLLRYFEILKICIKGRDMTDLVHLNKMGLSLLFGVIERFSKGIVQMSIKQGRVIFDPNIGPELEDENNYNQSVLKPIGQALPEIQVDVYGQLTKCLIDSGSQVTLISENKFQEIKSKYKGAIPELPCTNVSIVGITGVKSKRVEKRYY